MSVDNITAEFHASKFDAGYTPVYMGVACGIAALPVFLYNRVYALSLSEFGIVFAVIAAVSACLLFMAYTNVASTTGDAIFRNARKVKKVGSKAQKSTAAEAEASALALEAISWSLFINNLFFMAIFSFLGLYAFRSLSIQMNYACASSIASFVVWYMSQNSFKLQ